EEAIEEIKKCAGKQFDPFLAGKFIKIIEKGNGSGTGGTATDVISETGDMDGDPGETDGYGAAEAVGDGLGETVADGIIRPDNSSETDGNVVTDGTDTDSTKSRAPSAASASAASAVPG
ncbi:MAG TPA: hypothetical protein PLG72_08490, partial [Clostridiales bacterium]|nr:hypothetical protein [Clostridiales bacterium]